jgi:hypothetical protein
MLDKCANPMCSATFLRLHDGRLFVIEQETNQSISDYGHTRQRRYFWLCSSCCRTMTLVIDKAKYVKVSSAAIDCNDSPESS